VRHALFLGVEELTDFRTDTASVAIVAAELTTETGSENRRLPISETKYF